MHWLLLAVLSACLLGVYDAAKKAAVRDNAVPAVLFLSVLCGAAIWLPALLWGRAFPGWLPSQALRVEPLSLSMHLALLTKSTIVGVSWMLAYFALKRLPLSIASPIRAVGPLWTILIATLVLGERPNAWQWLGIAVVLVAFYAFSVAGKKEGIHFHRDRAVGLMLLATIVSACSGLYDKILLQTFALTPAAVQAWFSIYLVIVVAPFAAYWYVFDSRTSPLEFRQSIPMIAICLLAADFAYFTALSDPSAMVAIVSPVRRLATVVSFGFGVFYFREKNVQRKAVCVAVLLLGVLMISQG